MLNGIACNADLAGCGLTTTLIVQETPPLLPFIPQLPSNRQPKPDLGLRSEQHEVEYSVDEGLDGIITKAVDYDERKTSWTLGADYRLNEESGTFVRMNKGYKCLI